MSQSPRGAPVGIPIYSTWNTAILDNPVVAEVVNANTMYVELLDGLKPRLYTFKLRPWVDNYLTGWYDNAALYPNGFNDLWGAWS